MADNAFTVLVLFKIKPELRQKIFDFMLNDENGIKATKSSKGCISIEGRMATSDDESLAIWEKWASEEDYEAYRKKRADSGFLEKMAEFVSGPPVTMKLSKESF